jgi:hypothetical protein
MYLEKRGKRARREKRDETKGRGLRVKGKDGAAAVVLVVVVVEMFEIIKGEVGAVKDVCSYLRPQLAVAVPALALSAVRVRQWVVLIRVVIRDCVCAAMVAQSRGWLIVVSGRVYQVTLGRWRELCKQTRKKEMGRFS